MIDVRDLRLGNYVSAYGENYVAESLFDKNLAGLRQLEKQHKQDLPDGFFNTELNGILITPEWLEKLGFRLLYVDEEFADIARKDNAVVQTEGEMWRFIWHGEMGSDRVDTAVWYVHQLQNHYYLMTGEELTIGGEK